MPRSKPISEPSPIVSFRPTSLVLVLVLASYISLIFRKYHGNHINIFTVIITHLTMTYNNFTTVQLLYSQIFKIS